jgi:hypothetical protein
MSKPLHYLQCILQKIEGAGVLTQTSYIPDPYCVVGKVLKLRNEDEVWEDGWKVIEAGPAHDAEEVEARERSYLYFKDRIS